MNGQSSSAGSAGEPGDLLPGERELWTGRPVRVRLRPADVLLPVWVVGGMAVVLGGGFAEGRNGPPAVPLLVFAAFGVPLAIVIAYYCLVHRWIVRRGTAYTLTGLRVLVTSGVRRRRTASVYLDQISEPSARPGRDGTGTITLRENLALEAVPDAAAVCAQVSAARLAMQRREEPAPVPAEQAVEAVPERVTLASGERLLWTGRPSGRLPVWFGEYDAYMSVFGVYMVTFIVTAFGPAVIVAPPAALFLVLFTVLGLYMAVGRLVHRRLLIRNSVYVLTDRRLIACWGLISRGATEGRLRDLGPPELRGSLLTATPAGQEIDRRDSVLASPLRRNRSFLKDMLGPVVADGRPTFIGVPDARAVRDLICAAQLATRT
ncbi:MAG: hypothetical protein FWE35_21670 [Streptosporangiales bacterium]|nr:hypothetical protein [Streptosporangiales bacterium]